MSPQQLIEEVHRRLGKVHGKYDLSVFWIALSTDRDGFANDLREARGDSPIVPVILRKSGLFQDPNAVMNDVTSILYESKGEIASIGEDVRRCQGAYLVVLSRSELRLAVTSSPLRLPDWFPVNPGKEVTARIDDLTWSVHVRLSDEAVALNDLQRILHELDNVLVTRIQEVLRSHPRDVQSLWERIRREEERKPHEVLEKIHQELCRIQNPTSFRPSVSRSPSLIGRLWYEANRNSPDKLPKVAKALASALRIEQVGLRADNTTLVATLNRPTNPLIEQSTRWSFQLLVTIRCACQLVTSAAHADQYPMFPDVLLRATSRDLRQFLDEAIGILKSS